MKFSMALILLTLAAGCGNPHLKNNVNNHINRLYSTFTVNLYNHLKKNNIEFIQFWMMDPFNEDYNSETDPAFDKNSLPRGDMYINLGNISEDIVKDGRMSYENGIPATSSFANNLTIDTTNLAFVPVLPPIINAFSQDNNDRPQQDVGYDGLSDDNERIRFSRALSDIQGGGYDLGAPAVQAFLDDPSSDRYNFLRTDI